MRWFWIAILALAVLTGGMFAWPAGGPASAPSVTPTPPPSRPMEAPEPDAPVEAPAPATPPAPDTASSAERDDDLGPDQDVVISQPVERPRGELSELALSPRVATDMVRAIPLGAVGMVDTSIEGELNDLLGIDEATAAELAARAPTPTPEPESAPAPSPTYSGSGTQADPYRVPWELLVSARQTYRPRQGQTELPAWASELSGSWVRLSGFALLPVMQDSSDEILLMRNQWDGCCIGVPPTPYDAIEVKLTKPTTELARARLNYATITGKLDVDPYLVRDWLVGLYVMDEANLLVEGF